jgi:hypothetical protein
LIPPLFHCNVALRFVQGKAGVAKTMDLKKGTQL